MTSPTALWRSPAVQAACARLARATDATIQDAIAIQQIPAPTFDEAERARYVQARFEALRLADVKSDSTHNVYARLPGRERGPALLVTAHLDTVFGPETALAVRRDGERLWGAGIGDNSLGVAGLLRLATVMADTEPRRDIWFVANVGEEGLGNLNGMWRVVRALEERLGAVVVLEGAAFGVVIHRGIGVERRRLIVETEGGHAWSDFGAPSAIHVLCRIGAAIASLEVPEEPRTSYNLGQIEGGTSINTIAARASALLDLRSADPATLRALAEMVDRILAEQQVEGVTVQSEQIGSRPAGGVDEEHPLVRAALDSLGWVGHDEPRRRAASTDANVPLTLGLPAVCIGLTVGGNAHRVDEYIELPPLRHGLQHAYLTLVAALEGLP